MGQAPQKEPLDDSDLESEDREKPSHPAFDFFQGCQTSPRPDWGPKIHKFKMPGRLGAPKRKND